MKTLAMVTLWGSIACSAGGATDDMAPLTGDLAGLDLTGLSQADMSHITTEHDMTMANPAKLSCTSKSPCWDNCFANHTTFSTCKSNCGLGDGVSCWQLCTQQGVSFSTCKSYCNADPGCQAALCWEGCGAQGVTTSTCESYCGKSKTTCSS